MLQFLYSILLNNINTCSLNVNKMKNSVDSRKRDWSASHFQTSECPQKTFHTV